MTQYNKTMDETIEMPYAISLVGSRPESVMRSLISQLRSIKTLVLFHSANPISMAAANSISMTLHDVGIKVVKNQIEDVFNFFETFLSADYFCSKYGEPAWVNTTAGPGLGASALTTFATIHGIDLVSYDEEKDATFLVHLTELNELLQCSVKLNGLLEEIKSNDNCSMKQICSNLSISRSTASRQLKTLRRLNLINVSGSGRGRSPFIISMTSWGRQFCHYSGMD